MASLDWPDNLTCMFLHILPAHSGTGRICKLHTGRPHPRKNLLTVRQLWGNRAATASLCCPMHMGQTACSFAIRLFSCSADIQYMKKTNSRWWKKCEASKYTRAPVVKGTCSFVWIKLINKDLWLYANKCTCCSNTKPILIIHLVLICTNQRKRLILHTTLFQEITEQWSQLSFPPSSPCVQDKGASFMLISSDSGRWEAGACLGTVITLIPSNCYIHTPTGNTICRGNSRFSYA